MSDLFHEDIPDEYRHRVFDTMEGMTITVFQVLTKRPGPMRRFIADRYGNGLPDHIWLGASVEDNGVKKRIDILRDIKLQVGGTVFLSVEPLIGPVDQHDYADIDWVIAGGESGQKARPCQEEWVLDSIKKARQANAAVWFKQWGCWPSNPLWEQTSGGFQERVEQCKKLDLASDEQGGATVNGEIIHELPAIYDQLTEKINSRIVQ